MIGFKIMDFEKGVVKTLFHGLDGSRTVPRFEWLDAKTDDDVRDGPGNRWDRPGWHVLETLPQAVEYLKRFKHTDKKVIVTVTTKGDRWKKEHSPADGLWLCERMRIDGIVKLSPQIVNSMFKEEK